jgi:protoheme IX farnesyltransferase
VDKQKIKAYYIATKPGIVYGNSIHVLVGYLLAYHFGLTWTSLVGVMIGVALVIASACVANNYLDREIDSHMKRTLKRPLVTGVVGARNAIIYMILLGLIGSVVLLVMTNVLTFIFGVVAYIWYVWIYGYAKRRTYYSTVIGSVPGALPIVAGYTAVTDRVDLAVVLLFVMLCIWQIPHFYAIAIARKNEYRAASVPVITAHKTAQQIRRQMIAWTILYIISIVCLMLAQVVGIAGGVIWLGMAIYWLWHMLVLPKEYDEAVWAKKSFRLSLLLPIVLVIAAVMTVVL